MMAYLQLKSILWTSRSLLNSASIKETNNNYVRYMSAKRDKLYGVEEGHGEQKNEVRKEKFWRKRNPARTGGQWREHNNYDKHAALTHGALSMIPDWSDESGEIGAPTPLQEQIMEQNFRLINEVYEAAMIVKKAQEFELSESRNSDIVGTDPEQKS